MLREEYWDKFGMLVVTMIFLYNYWELSNSMKQSPS